MTDAGLARLTALSELEWLTLSGTRITNAGLAHLHRLASLKGLMLANTQVDQTGIAALRTTLPFVQLAQ